MLQPCSGLDLRRKWPKTSQSQPEPPSLSRRSSPLIMAIRFIYFDLGNVLLNFDHRRAASQMAAVAGLPVEQVWNLIFESDLLLRVESGQITDQQFYEIFCEETQTRADFAKLQQAGSDIFGLNREMVPLLQHLHSAGHPSGILSNTSKSHWDFVCQGQYAILPGTFRHAVLSFEVGAAKPDQKIYEIAIERAGVAAEEIFFTDDREENVAGARAAGIDAVQFHSAAQLVLELRARGVRCNY